MSLFFSAAAAAAAGISNSTGAPAGAPGTSTAPGVIPNAAGGGYVFSPQDQQYLAAALAQGQILPGKFIT